MSTIVDEYYVRKSHNGRLIVRTFQDERAELVCQRHQRGAHNAGGELGWYDTAHGIITGEVQRALVDLVVHIHERRAKLETMIGGPWVDIDRRSARGGLAELDHLIEWMADR